ncbi:hypothetical protein [Streptomyces sp. B3I8]|uniref:hypothetical protein n=1 Tax=Streptomyces sp. B3I8 TaxID=3042303 RepID=UPI00277FDA18|nr:hypothetical protein [Streptomyces sp. B3I8]MDQ0784837.1 hypothetical protein [Streptomyces sp. B3I8]
MTAMGTKTSRDAVPTAYQSRLLLAALNDPRHRLPSGVRRATTDVMRRRQWVREYGVDGRPVDDGRLPGAGAPLSRFRLTHHGVNAARRARQAQAGPVRPDIASQERPEMTFGRTVSGSGHRVSSRVDQHR